MGFTADSDGVLRVLKGAVITLAKTTGLFFELKIALCNGAAVTAVLSTFAVKVNCEEA